MISDRKPMCQVKSKSSMAILLLLAEVGLVLFPCYICDFFFASCLLCKSCSIKLIFSSHLNTSRSICFFCRHLKFKGFHENFFFVSVKNIGYNNLTNLTCDIVLNLWANQYSFKNLKWNFFWVATNLLVCVNSEILQVSELYNKLQNSS